ncbi:activator of Hsp90 ATPase-like protein [Anseongella ginsenosidimutans]|uniref:Activator of Hsp90 ATPase-like protein n=1 Tax=Anseongella ginsenosidimutans TaxID=496056 RepID=A0A4R3KYL1_9SPHI|nr:SRPBCC domain-containing protein [Anseongella ginsenosidimutans]QEC51720.1 SRPBCC domain-containing protein [Anseongella ginsenosidimutans]TCS89082.1 activator of Hsp90 ATPase-like protein [Anseongella ginsenosidimutans]
METLQFKKEINAAVDKVYKTMIGKETFKQWTAVFNPSSEFEGGGDVEGSWEKGSKILFIGASKEGKREGMVGYIRENTPNRHISIEYTGIVDGENELTEGPVAEEWQGFENYTFESRDGTTTVTVDIDVNDQMLEYFRITYPKALDKLKEICEG